MPAEHGGSGLREPVKLVDVNQIDLLKLPKGSNKAERNRHGRELRRKYPRLITTGLITLAWPGSKKRDIMTMLGKCLAHGLDRPNRATLEGIEGMDNMQQPQPSFQKLLP
jgi:hypothetical protein